MGLFDAMAYVSAVNRGIEAGQKHVEDGRQIAVARDAALMANIKEQRSLADIAGLQLPSATAMPALPRRPGSVGNYAGPAGPSAAQIAASTPVGLAPKPSMAVGSGDTGYVPPSAASVALPPSGVPLPMPRNMIGRTGAAGITQIDPNSSQLSQDFNSWRAGVDVDTAINDAKKKIARGYGDKLGTAPLNRAWGYAVDNPADKIDRAEAKAAYDWLGSPAGKAYLQNNPNMLADATKDPVAHYRDYIYDPNAPIPAAKTPAGKKPAAAGLVSTPAAKALADQQPAAAAATASPKSAVGKPADGTPLAAAAPPTASSASAIEGARQFNIEINRMLNTRSVIGRNAQQQYDQNMSLAREAEIYAKNARSVQDLAGYKSNRKQAMEFRNLATAAHAKAVDSINKIDAAMQSNILGFAGQRLHDLNDTSMMSQVMSQQTGQTTYIRPSGTLGTDGKPTFNMWLQSRAGKWTAVADNKSGKPATFSAGEITERAQKLSSASYRSDVAKSAHNEQVANRKTEREVHKKIMEEKAKMYAEIGKRLADDSYETVSGKDDPRGIIVRQRKHRRGDGKDIMIINPDAAANAYNGAPGTPPVVRYIGGS